MIGKLLAEGPAMLKELGLGNFASTEDETGSAIRMTRQYRDSLMRPGPLMRLSLPQNGRFLVKPLIPCDDWCASRFGSNLPPTPWWK
jgi:hypothetical protein